MLHELCQQHNVVSILSILYKHISYQESIFIVNKVDIDSK